LFDGFYDDDVITRAEFEEQFNAETNGQYADEIDRIHAYSMNRLSELRAESNAQNAVERVRADNPDITDAEVQDKIADEQAKAKERNKIRGEHRKLANAILKAEGVLSKRQKASLIKQYEAAQQKGEKSRLAAKQKILDFLETAATIAPNADENVLAAAALLDNEPTMSSTELSKRLRQMSPELEPAKDASNADRTKAYNKIAGILGQAEKLRQQVKAENWKQAEIARGKTEEAKEAMKEAKRARTDARKSFDSLVSRLEKPPQSAVQKAAQLQRMMMVSAINTAANNMVSGVATRFQHRIVDAMDVGFQKGARLLGKELKNEGLTADTRWMDVLGFPQGDKAGFKAYFAQTVAAHKTILAGLDEHPELFNELYGDYSSDIASLDDVRGEKGGFIHKALDAGIWAYDKLNFANRWQEYFVRDLETLHALQTRLGQRGLNLSDLETAGELNKITLDDWKYAIERARTVTYALHPERGTTADRVLRKLNDHPVPTVIVAPFAKFSWNAWNMTRKWMPVIAQIRAMRRVKGEEGATVKDLFNPMNYTSREMANSLAGFVFLAAAYGLVRGLGDRDDWYYLKIPFTDGMGRNDPETGKPSSLYIDIRQHPQFAPFVYMANKLNRLMSGKDMFNYDDAKTIASEIGEVFFSLSYRQAIDQNSLLQGVGYSISSALQRDNAESKEKAWHLLSKFAGERLGMAFSPLRPLKNVLDSMSKSGDLDLDSYPFTQGLERNMPKWLLEKGGLPGESGFETKKNAVTGAEKKYNPYAYLKPLGLNVVDAQIAEAEMSQTLRTAKKLVNDKPYSPPITGAEKKAAETKKDIYRELERLRKLETPGMTKKQKDELYAPVNDAIKRATDAGIITEGQGEYMERGQGVSQLISYVKRADPSKSLTIYEVSKTDDKLTPAEKSEIAKLTAMKLLKSDKTTKADRDRAKALGLDMASSLGSVEEMLNAPEMKKATTDDLVDLLNIEYDTPEDREKVAEALRKKARNAQKSKTLTPDEVERIKAVLPDFQITPREKKPKAEKPAKQSKWTGQIPSTNIIDLR